MSSSLIAVDYWGSEPLRVSLSGSDPVESGIESLP